MYFFAGSNWDRLNIIIIFKLDIQSVLWNQRPYRASIVVISLWLVINAFSYYKQLFYFKSLE